MMERSVRDQAKLDQIVDEVAGFTDRNVSLDDLYGKVLAYHTGKPTTDRARVESIVMKAVPADVVAWENQWAPSSKSQPFIVPANPCLQLLARLCIPLLHEGFRLGYLWVLAANGHDSLELLLQQVETMAPRFEGLAVEVMEALGEDHRTTTAREAALRSLLRGNADRPAAQQAIWEAAHAPGKRVAVILLPATGDRRDAMPSHLSQRPVRQAVTDALRTVRDQLLWMVDADHVALLLPASFSARDASALAAAFRQALEVRTDAPQPDHGQVALGTSSAAGDLTVRYREAVVAAQAGAVDPAAAAGGQWESAGIYQFLARANAAPHPHSTRYAALRGAARGADLLEMLEMVYDSDAPRQELASRLHIHRTSLYNRLQRMQTILGEDPLSSAVRLDLHLAMKVQRWARRPQVAWFDAEPAA